MVKIAPSILAADFTNLKQQIIEAENGGADWIHLDIMDGHFVPNITFGPMIVKAVRDCTNLPLDVHLMVDEPDTCIENFRQAGADIITVHQEACVHLYRTIQFIKDLKAKAGVALNPSTPVSSIKEIISELDLVLIMTVEPGFGNQQFISSTLGKIRETKDMIVDLPKEYFIEVDGGINKETAAKVIHEGANVLVAGTAIFNAPSISNAISALRFIKPDSK